MFLQFAFGGWQIELLLVEGKEVLAIHFYQSHVAVNLFISSSVNVI